VWTPAVLFHGSLSQKGTLGDLFRRGDHVALPLEVVEMLGGTIAKVVPITIVLALVFSC